MKAIDRSPADTKDARAAGRITRAFKVLKSSIQKRSTPDMEWFDIFKYVIAIVLAAVAAFCPPFFSKLKAVKKATEEASAALAERDAAVEAAEQASAQAKAAQAEIDLTGVMQAEVEAAEKTYQTFDAAAKQSGTSCGPLKREHVLGKLQTYALSKGYTFDAEKWGIAIDTFVAVTKVVNAIKR